jgi:predicted PurR-regulated permease PerM
MNMNQTQTIDDIQVIVPPTAPASNEIPVRERAISGSVTAIAVVGAVCYLIQPVLITLFVSTLLAFLIAPATDLLQKLRFPRSLAASLTVTSTVLIAYAITYFSYDRGIDFIEDLPRYVSSYRDTIGRVRQKAEAIQQTSDTLLPKTAADKKAIAVVPRTNWVEILARNVGSLAEFIFLLAFVPFLTFFMLTWHNRLHSATVLLFAPEHRRKMHRVIRLVASMIRGFLMGNLLIGLFMSLLSTLVFGLVGLPYFYFAGFLSGFLSLVPYLGVILGLLPPLLLAGAEPRGGRELLIIGGAVIGLHILSLNVLYPKFLGNRMRLNPLVVTMALLFWGWLWGGIGLILAMPITATMKIIFDRFDSLRAYGAWMGDHPYPRRLQRRSLST